MSDDRGRPKSIAIYYLNCILPAVTNVAMDCGYAIGVHGSMSRDFDLIAAPWVDDAKSAEELIEAIRVKVSGYIVEDGTEGGKWNPETKVFDKAIIRQPEAKPHGRLGWSIHLGAGAYIDISVMPRRTE